jgi:hypothetical protein
VNKQLKTDKLVAAAGLSKLELVVIEYLKIYNIYFTLGQHSIQQLKKQIIL